MSDSNDEAGPSLKKRRNLSPKSLFECSDENPLDNSSPDDVIDSDDSNDVNDCNEFNDANDTIDENSQETNKPKNSQNIDESFKDEITISDLDEKCLVHIFDNLHFIDLLNVANTSLKFCKAASVIYARRYADKLVKYNGDAINTKGLEIDVTDNTIEINEARSCLKMLRGFGGSITRLKLNFNGIGQRRIQAISRTLTEYCAKTLINLEWHYCPKNSLEHATKKFPKLEILRVVYGTFGVEMCQINYFFPNLQRLELTGVEVVDRKCIERTIHSVVHMKLNIESRKGMDFLKSNIKACLNLNPQLTSFSIGYGCDVKLLDYINEQLPKLETLEIQKPRNKFFDSNETKIHFRMVKNLILDTSDSKDTFTNIPFTFRRLKRFTLIASFVHRDEWINFAVQNKRLLELKLLNFHWFYVLERANLMKIAELPRLTNLILDWRVSSTGTVARFLEECKNLKKLRLSLRTRPERAAICAEIGNEWQAHIDEHFLTLEKIDGVKSEGLTVKVDCD